MGFADRKAPAGQQQIGKGEQRIGLCGVFRQASITHSSMTKPVLDDMGRMLDFRPDAGLQMLELFPHASQFIVGQRLAFGALHGHMPRHRFADIFKPLFHALVAGVAVRQRMRRVGDISVRADDGVHQARSGIDADVGLHAEVPVIAFLRRVHLWIALAVLVFGRRRRGD